MSRKKRYLQANKFYTESTEETTDIAPFHLGNPSLQAPPPLVQKQAPRALSQSKGPLPAVYTSSQETSQQLLEELGSQVLFGEDNGAQTFWIDLKHEILGGLQIRISMKKREVSAIILAPSATIQILIEKNLDQLKSMLYRRGLAIGSISVKLKSR